MVSCGSTWFCWAESICLCITFILWVLPWFCLCVQVLKLSHPQQTVFKAFKLSWSLEGSKLNTVQIPLCVSASVCVCRALGALACRPMLGPVRCEKAFCQTSPFLLGLFILCVCVCVCVGWWVRPAPVFTNKQPLNSTKFATKPKGDQQREV